MGLPMILSLPKGEATALIEKTGSGVVIAPEAPEILAETVIGLSENRKKLKELSIASTDAASSYSRERQAHRMLGVLDKVVSGGRE